MNKKTKIPVRAASSNRPNIPVPAASSNPQGAVFGQVKKNYFLISI